jgi:hypothetical protein
MSKSNRRVVLLRPELQAIDRIAQRALRFFPDREAEDIKLDLTAAILGGCPMHLDQLEIASDSDFVHDIAGIARHLDRQTFELKDCFLPRYAKLELRQ